MKLSVFRVLASGCLDGVRAARQFPALVVLFIAVTVALDWLSAVLQEQLPSGGVATDIALAVAGILTLVPLTIPFYRFLLRGDTDPFSGLDIRSRRVRLSAGLYVLVSVAVIVLMLAIMAAVEAADVSNAPDLVAWLVLLAVAAFVPLVIVLITKLALIFAAIAVDATTWPAPSARFAVISGASFSCWRCCSFRWPSGSRPSGRSGYPFRRRMSGTPGGGA